MTNPADYPKDDKFISSMSLHDVKRIKACDWKIEGTIFLEIPYCAISGVGAGIARDYEHKLYYTIFYATEGVINSLYDDELKVVLDHEQDEISSTLSNANEGIKRPAFTSLDDEKKRHDEELKEIEIRHGSEVVNEAIRKVRNAASLKPLIPRYVLAFWINVLIINNYEKYSKYAYDMTKGMLTTEERNVFKETINKVRDEYGSNSPMQEWSKLYRSVIKA